MNWVASPTKIPEYLRCGLALVATRGIGQTDTLIEKHHCGWLIDEISNNNYSGNDALKPMRGGGYWHSPELLKTTMRYGYDPTTKVSGFGLRIVMEDIE